MKIIVMGDTHADFGTVNTFINKKKPDIILQAGDFGWWPHCHGTERISRNRTFDQYALKLHDTKLFWCDGNHENHDDLQARVAAAPDGGPLEIPVPGAFYMRRGSILTLPDDRKVLFFGGGMSTDQDERKEGEDWWPGELPTQADLDYALDQVKSHGGLVDIVISHVAPRTFLGQMAVKTKEKLADPTSDLLDVILDTCKPLVWYFGHYHQVAMGDAKGCRWYCLNMSWHRQGWCRQLDPVRYRFEG